jgi:hypothetical protein
VTCVSGCSCNSAIFDGHIPDHHVSVPQFIGVQVTSTSADSCVVQVIQHGGPQTCQTSS